MSTLRLVEYPQPQPQPEGDATLLGLFLDAHREHPRTVAIYRSALCSFLAQLRKPLCQVELADLQGWVAGLYRSGQRESTVRLKYRVLCAFLRFARELGSKSGGLDGIPPLKAVDLRGVPDSVAVRLIQPQELKRLFDCATSYERLVLQLLYFTALRRSELVGLRWRDLRARGEGEGGLALIPPGKGGRSRTVGIPPRLWRELQHLRGPWTPETAPVLGLSDSQLYRLVKRAGARAGLPQVAPHFFRHQHITDARRAGADWDVIAAQAGHSSPSLTQRVYGHLTHETTSADILEAQHDEQG